MRNLLTDEEIRCVIFHLRGSNFPNDHQLADTLEDFLTRRITTQGAFLEVDDSILQFKALSADELNQTQSLLDQYKDNINEPVEAFGRLLRTIRELQAQLADAELAVQLMFAENCCTRLNQPKLFSPSSRHDVAESELTILMQQIADSQASPRGYGYTYWPPKWSFTLYKQCQEVLVENLSSSWLSKPNAERLRELANDLNGWAHIRLGHLDFYSTQEWLELYAMWLKQGAPHG